jgi:hypothetical protein
LPLLTFIISRQMKWLKWRTVIGTGLDTDAQPR